VSPGYDRDRRERDDHGGGQAREAGCGRQRNVAGAIGNGEDSSPRNNLDQAPVCVRALTVRRFAPPVTG
jgi:hypothetical protein